MSDALAPADRLAIEQLVHRHAWLIDHGRASEVEALFTEDAVLKGIGADKVGRAAIGDWARQREAMRERRSRHVQTNLLIDADGADRAQGTAVLTLYRHDGQGDGPSTPILIGEYADLYRKEADGAWRFAERRLITIFGRG